MRVSAGWERGRPWLVVVLPRWLQKVTGVLFLDDLWARWTCDQCEAMGVHRKVWIAFGRMWKHELTHTDEEWSAAGYDKQGTLEFYRNGPSVSQEG